MSTAIEQHKCSGRGREVMKKKTTWEKQPPSLALAKQNGTVDENPNKLLLKLLPPVWPGKVVRGGRVGTHTSVISIVQEAEAGGGTGTGWGRFRELKAGLLTAVGIFMQLKVVR